MGEARTDGQSRSEKERCGRVALRETLRQDGVVCMRTSFTDKLGIRKTPGVRVRRDWKGRLRVSISVIARDGMDLRQLALTIQEAVLAGLEREGGPPVDQVDVWVAGVTAG